MYVLGHLYKQVQDWNRNYVNGDNLNVNIDKIKIFKNG